MKVFFTGVQAFDVDAFEHDVEAIAAENNWTR